MTDNNKRYRQRIVSRLMLLGCKIGNALRCRNKMQYILQLRSDAEAILKRADALESELRDDCTNIVTNKRERRELKIKLRLAKRFTDLEREGIESLYATRTQEEWILILFS